MEDNNNNNNNELIQLLGAIVKKILGVEDELQTLIFALYVIGFLVIILISPIYFFAFKAAGININIFIQIVLTIVIEFCWYKIFHGGIYNDEQ